MSIIFIFLTLNPDHQFSTYLTSQWTANRLRNTWPGISLCACADGVKSAILQVRKFAWHREENVQVNQTHELLLGVLLTSNTKTHKHKDELGTASNNAVIAEFLYWFRAIVGLYQQSFPWLFDCCCISSNASGTNFSEF